MMTERLQTFPDSFKFKGSQTDIFKMIGNAEPPMLAEAIALETIRLILPNWRMSTRWL
jgi:DNA (cytosine-5)-methyltransferase 1